MRLRSVKKQYNLRAISEQLYLRGSIVGLWAGIESSLDRANHAAWITSRDPARKKLPRNFSEKIKSFRELPLHSSTFTELSETGTRLADRVEARIEDRHFLVHGYTVPSSNGDSNLLLRKHKFLSNTITDEDRTYTIVDLRKFNDETLKLSHDWACYLGDLTKKLGLHSNDLPA